MSLRRQNHPNFVNSQAPQGGGAGRVFVFFLFFLIIVFLIAFAWIFRDYAKMKNELVSLKSSNPKENVIEEDIGKLLEDVGQLIYLPQGEDPVVATIQDAEKISKEMPFYRDVKNGDKVLVFKNAKKAIIYSPSENKIVNVGPISFEQEAPQDFPKENKEILEEGEKEEKVVAETPSSTEPIKIGE